MNDAGIFTSVLVAILIGFWLTGKSRIVRENGRSKRVADWLFVLPGWILLLGGLAVAGYKVLGYVKFQ